MFSGLNVQVSEIDWSSWENPAAMMSRPDYKYKLLVVGDPKIGKTSFIRKFSDNNFEEKAIEGNSREVKRCLRNGKVVLLTIYVNVTSRNFVS